ncbi:MAG: 2,3-bisphosphoglycerate-dependent phosphoglycerate mutase [Maribacter sp.]|jgi:2,3-bisphosphoglycerate-dependent phosphoglycerate mutase
MKYFTILACSLLLLFSSCKTNNIASGQVILARHAERDDGVDALNAIGEQRAIDLAEILHDTDIEAVYCSQYERTKETARAICEALGLEPTIYDAHQIYELAIRIKKHHAGKTVLVIGHSNTVPATINEFGIVPPLEDLGHDEYSNLYILNYGRKNSLILLQFGE